MGQVVQLNDDYDHEAWELALEDDFMQYVDNDEMWSDSHMYQSNDPAMPIVNGVVLFFVVMGAVGALLKG